MERMTDKQIRERAMGWVQEMELCSHPESHGAHMYTNGECPWCYAYDPAAVEAAEFENYVE